MLWRQFFEEIGNQFLPEFQGMRNIRNLEEVGWKPEEQVRCPYLFPIYPRLLSKIHTGIFIEEQLRLP